MGDKDIIGKETLRRLAFDLATYLLHLDVDPDSLEVLDTEQHRIEDRRADLVVRLRGRDGVAFLLHIEIQNGNDPTMPWRMLRYRTDIALRHPGEPIRQYLIYIGREGLRMPEGIEQEGLSYRYGLIDMRNVDCETLLIQDNPDALILAILCDFRDKDPQAVVNYILGRLYTLLKDNPRRLREYTDMLEILSDNRDLKAQIQEAEKMLTQVKRQDLPSYRIGLEDGILQGMEKGIERGRQRGEVVLLERMLRLRFGPLPEAWRERLDQSTEVERALWSERLLSAASLEQVFREG
jgi:predicted transposase YdaD